MSASVAGSGSGSGSGSGRMINLLLSKLESLSEEEVEEVFSSANIAMLIPPMITAGLITPDEVQLFIFAKNVKLFGGINEYIDDFLTKIMPRIRDMKQAEKIATKRGAIATLNRMKTFAGIDADHVKRVEEALEELQAMKGGAAAGKKSRKSRKNRNKTHRIRK